MSCKRQNLLIGKVCNRKQMRVLILFSLPTVRLNQTGVVEIIHTVERVCGNEDNSRICVNFPFGISKLNGLKHCNTVRPRVSLYPEYSYQQARSNAKALLGHL